MNKLALALLGALLVIGVIVIEVGVITLALGALNWMWKSGYDLNFLLKTAVTLYVARLILNPNSLRNKGGN